MPLPNKRWKEEIKLTACVDQSQVAFPVNDYVNVHILIFDLGTGPMGHKSICCQKYLLSEHCFVPLDRWHQMLDLGDSHKEQAGY